METPRDSVDQINGPSCIHRRMGGREQGSRKHRQTLSDGRGKKEKDGFCAQRSQSLFKKLKRLQKGKRPKPRKELKKKENNKDKGSMLPRRGIGNQWS